MIVTSNNRVFHLLMKKEKKKMNKKGKEIQHRKILINSVLSWTLQDVLNHHLYKDKVETIPKTFSSVEQYLNSYRYPLLEEIHAEMYAGVENLSQPPACRIVSVKKDRSYKPHGKLLHQVIFDGQYQPYCNDVVALLDARPTSLEDLHNPRRLFVPAIVVDVNIKRKHNMIQILTLKPIMAEKGEEKMIEPRFAVFLLNLLPSLRIWEALNGRNFSILKEVVSFDSRVEVSCGLCSQKVKCLQENNLHTFNLNESQLEAVISSIETSKCDHKSSVKLIWGPPGTGKTKTVSVILFELLKMKCKTLTCAPTNTAIVEVTSRLMKIVRDASLQNGSYGLGDILLLGNKDRLKMHEHDHLADVFLDNRVEALSQCSVSFSKWGSWIKTMTSLLKDSYQLYRKYLESRKNTKTENRTCCLFCGKRDQVDDLEDEKLNIALRISLFMRRQLRYFEKEMSSCIKCMCTHMPTSIVSVKMVGNMFRALELFKYFTSLLQDGSFTDQQVRKIFSGSETIQFTVSDPSLRFLSKTRNECLEILNSLTKVSIPMFGNDRAIRMLCLQRACLTFCTTSSSAKLTKITKTKLVIIDEAAQLKECESAIPLQLPNVQHAILIGDERQLPAMVQSKISEEAEFGRSLFERLVSLGHKTHLLNVQYRMHPSISLFPNSEFYSKQIYDAYSVQQKSYTKHLLQGNMYGPYSFINMSCGKEELDDKHSLNNMMEVAVIAEIIENLYKASVANRQKVSVGVISPYNVQVIAISKKLGFKYVSHSDFSVSVRSVDGFQGGEEDIILISTVRSNDYGSIGFLANHQRTNVALTRARYCLWILGDGKTLMKNNSVWRKIVVDAKGRGCYFNAEDDKRLSKVILDSLVECGQLNDLLRMKSLIFKGARWKVIFKDDFWKSFVRIKGVVTRKDVVAILMKLATGWRDRPSRSRRKKLAITNGASSPLLKQNNVDGFYKLLWTIDIVKENKKHTQVIKILNVLPHMEIPRLAKNLDTIFGSYSIEKMSRCEFKCLEGTLEVPMSWESHWVTKQRYLKLKELSTGLASLSLWDRKTKELIEASRES
ncbi:probable helicase MAGATAMA 3 isoform X2 [Papaver somniferum]|uniref:probable helicase MAGATAMA 3 isoform X2 n=1 Tax=Papaver somniferum TaxID=3469 RepID=UPI000E705BED|nr:probable helicase MAGATAMA 3 isoform X2 [Papaver somniferum]